MKKVSATRLLVLLASITLLTFTVGCASTGGGGGGGGDVAKAPDYTQEMGDNGLPTPRALNARYVEAVGGAAALRAKPSTNMKGTFELPAMGVSGDLVIHAQAPNLVVTNIEMGGMGSMSNGYNGEIGWSVNPMTGASLLEGTMLAQAADEANYWAELEFDTAYPESETVGETEWEGKAAYEVNLVGAGGTKQTRYYDKESSLVLGTVTTQVSEMGEAEVTIINNPYEEHDGIMVPMGQTMKMMGMEIKNTITEINYESAPEGAFEPPAEIKALLEE